jgi:transcription termination/antitermination protein NusA
MTPHPSRQQRDDGLVLATVGRAEGGDVLVDLDGIAAVLPAQEQVPGESFRNGDRIMAYRLGSDGGTAGAAVVISRAHKGLLEKLFQLEVPEIHDGIVRIQASAREPGVRSKIAVSALDGDVDPVEVCLGSRSARLQAVVKELRGERVDIVRWDPDPARFVCNAIAPAEVSRVVIDAATHTMQLIVPDHSVAVAVGENGQHVRLVSQLTGWNLAIASG